jgi:hypothetical protein
MVDHTVPEHPLPTFLIIGAQKSATRWLRTSLGAHPDVYAVDEELSFFNIPPTFRDLGVDWYREQFAGWQGQPLVGESTPGYMMLRHDPEVVAHRIQRIVPDVRLLAVLRDPVDRANSAMVHHIVRHRLPTDVDLAGFLRAQPAEAARLELIAGGWYAASLEPFVHLFGEQLRVLLYDDLLTDPRAFYADALSHLVADTTFVPPGLDERFRSNQQARPQLEGVDRAVEMAWLAKRRLSGVPKARRGPRHLAESSRREVYELFRHDVEALEVLIDRDLSAWDPERAAGPARRTEGR